MSNPLTMRLQQAAVLNAEDRRELDRLVDRSAQRPRRESIMTEGEPCHVVHMLLTGWACRFKLVPGAARQIVAFMLPGDHSPVHSGRGHAATYGICALTGCELAEIDGRELERLIQERPNLDRAFQSSSILDEAVLQEWLANVGRRPAERRMAHLLCELLLRLQTVGLASADTFALPLTQTTLGDALGLSSAHVNRTLQALRARDFVFFEDGEVRMSNVARLQRFAGFNPRYLSPRAASLEMSS